ncbi:FAD-dependent oxidoreductase [Fodinicola feengrottensis]
MNSVDIVAIGAGQAGLASAYYLQREGADFVVLDRQMAPGGAWQQVWRSVRLVSPPLYTRLPGLAWDLPFHHPPSGPEVSGYFADYEKHYALPIQRPVRVRSVSGDGRLLVRTDSGDWSARTVINATGTWDHPFVPSVPGMASFLGRQLHTASYDTPEEFAGQHVVVVGRRKLGRADSRRSLHGGPYDLGHPPPAGPTRWARDRKGPGRGDRPSG